MHPVVVVHIECGAETVLVRNTQGLRQSWQLPGGRIEYENEAAQAARRIFDETGLRVSRPQFHLVKKFVRNMGRSRQVVHVYHTRLPAESLRDLHDPSPNGHRTRRELSTNLPKVLGKDDLALLTD